MDSCCVRINHNCLASVHSDICFKGIWFRWWFDYRRPGRIDSAHADLHKRWPLSIWACAIVALCIGCCFSLTLDCYFFLEGLLTQWAYGNIQLCSIYCSGASRCSCKVWSLDWTCLSRDYCVWYPQICVEVDEMKLRCSSRLIKCSILAFYRRIVPKDKHRQFLYVLALAIIVQSLINILVGYFIRTVMKLNAKCKRRWLFSRLILDSLGGM